MADSSWRHLILKVTIMSLLQNALSYSFRNCIEVQYSHHKTFQCFKSQELEIGKIVRDIFTTATNLTISRCNLPDIGNQSFHRLPNLTSLVLDYNNHSRIDQDAFGNLQKLHMLNLSSNSISSLYGKVFHNLHSLEMLLLSYNKLQNIDVLLFSQLRNLKTLDLKGNGLNNFSLLVESITHLPNLTQLELSFNDLSDLHHSSSLPQSLTTLYLSSNQLHSLGCDKSFLVHVKVLDFSYNTNLSSNSFQGLNLAGLTNLHLSFTNVSVSKLLNKSRVRPSVIDYSGLKLNDNLSQNLLCSRLRQEKKDLFKLILQSNNLSRAYNFSNCPNVTGLIDLSRNEMKFIGCLAFLQGQKHLRSLKVEHNHLSSLRSCNKCETFPSLQNLSYRYNRILQVSGCAFCHTPKLIKLELNINIIAYLDHHALDGLKDLTTLRLDNNLLTDVYCDSFKDLTSLKTLNLRNNQIAVVFEDVFQNLSSLTILDLGGNKISQLKPKAFNGLQSLSNLYLDRNRLKEIHSIGFSKLFPTLKVLDLQANRILYFTECKNSPFDNMSRLLDLKLDSQEPRGINMLPGKFFQGLTSLKSLYLTNNHITAFGAEAFDDLKNLEFLTLDNSCVGITQLNPGIFKNLKKLKRLYVENMGIKSFSKGVFGNLTGLEEIHLNRNAMTSLDINVLRNLPNLAYMDLRSCPLSCGCQNSDLQSWINKNNSIQFPYFYNITCQEQPESYFYNFDTKVCFLDLGLYLFSFTYTFTLLMIFIPFLYVRLYWKFKYGYYVFRSWFGEQLHRLRDQEENYKYDAFISYNSADETWVMEELLPTLEASSFRICLHHRDFEPGRAIVDNIVSAVYSSRKTICVVSQNFLNSEWCSLEIQLASYRLFQEMQDVLLLIFLEPISDRQLSAYHRMRKVMLKKTYLQWHGPNCSDPSSANELFWSQLKRALKSSNIGGQEEQNMVENKREDLGLGTGQREYFLNETPKNDEGYFLVP